MHPPFRATAPVTRAIAAIALALAAPLVAQVGPPAHFASAELSPETGADDAPPSLLSGFGARGTVRDMLTSPLVDRAPDGSIWARTRDLRAHFDGVSTTVYPVFGKVSPQEWPVSFTIRGARLGASALEIMPASAPQLEGSTVATEHGALRAEQHLSLQGVEQTFVFETLPAADGDLVLELAVATELSVVDQDGALSFTHEALGGVSYGEAFVFDAARRRAAITRTWNGSSIELRVPHEFLAEAVLPVTIDPLISAFSNSLGVADDARPDIVYCGQTNEWLLCWEEFTSSSNSDTYVTKWDRDVTTQGPVLALDISNNTWVAPRIAYTFQGDTALVVANSNPVPTGFPDSAIVGRIVDVAAFTVNAGTLIISSIGTPKGGVCVGGAVRVNASEEHFCVAWSQPSAAGQLDIRYRLVDPDGTFATGIGTLSSSLDDDVTPSISKSLGAGAAPDLFWAVVWIRDDNGDGVGDVDCRHIAYDGSSTSAVFSVVATNCSNPVVSSRLTTPLAATGIRPNVVAFERHFGADTDIQAEVISDTASFGAMSVTQAEGFGNLLAQRRPAIATNGHGVFIAYLEEHWGAVGSGDWNAFVSTASVLDLVGDASLALAERHLPLATTAQPELALQIACVRDGDALDTSSLTAGIWARESAGNTNGFGGIHGATFSHYAALFFGPRAVGRHYCAALPNSNPQFGGRVTSWLRIMGDGSAGSMHVAECIDMPPQTFAMLLVGTDPGSLLYPGGSRGRLCLSGDIGRYTNQIMLTDGGGAASFQIDPSQLPQPNSFVAALPGETWYFQVWHRELILGSQTSNFSNGVSLYFRN